MKSTTIKPKEHITNLSINIGCPSTSMTDNGSDSTTLSGKNKDSKGIEGLNQNERTGKYWRNDYY